MVDDPSPRVPLFSANLFVPRQNTFNKLDIWVANSVPEEYVLPLEGLPGAGKSWVMAAFALELNSRERQCVVWLDVAPGAINPMSGRPVPDLKADLGRLQWLEDAIDDASKVFGVTTITDLDKTVSLDSMLRNFVEKLCQVVEEHHAPPPVLLVDNLDKLDQVWRRYFESRVIGQFLPHFAKCFRIIIARRAEDRLVDPSMRQYERRTPITLPSFIMTEAQTQVAQRAQALFQHLKKTHRERAEVRYIGLQRFLEVTLTLKEMRSVYKLTQEQVMQAGDAIMPYLSLIPLVNTFLFARAIVSQDGTVSQDELWVCFDAYCQRAALADSVVERLRRVVAELPERWSLDDLTSLGIGMEELESLWTAGILSDYPSTIQYGLDPGFRELVRNLLQPVSKQPIGST